MSGKGAILRSYRYATSLLEPAAAGNAPRVPHLSPTRARAAHAERGIGQPPCRGRRRWHEAPASEPAPPKYTKRTRGRKPRNGTHCT